MRWKIRRETAKTAQRAALTSLEATEARSLAGRPIVGEYTGLCILVDFPDSKGTISREQVDAFCNLKGYNEFGNNGSVYDYFHDNSGGRLHYKNIVTDYYTAQHNRAYYTDKNVPFMVRAQELVKEALDHLKAGGFDAKELSADESDFIYATNIFYSGNRDNNWNEGLWPHSERLPGNYELAPQRIVGDYQISNMGTELALGAFCHENGHMICDFPDLYDYGEDKFRSFGVGAFCLMCFGGNISEKNPTQVSAYLKNRAGWTDKLTAITAKMSAAVSAGVNDFYIHQKNATEYFIIENREQKNRDAALPAAGMAIWHVDEQGSNENQQMSPTQHYECALVQADGKFDFEQGLSHFGDQGDLFHLGGNNQLGCSTKPGSQWWDGNQSGLELSDISACGNLMSFKADIG